ncbi:hypothetical protein D2962_14920 [Biomaibacter acetigenes]|uniref:Uncharacterized protein n=1 Tax=Biomaibacter acetigenes TaxID=2316383 RepID=A0A3G2RAF2_9FIRM|nr:ATP-binding protein [Biomaibacter acetigenes]AYO31717.1 hypothetical protein D2962_14920 [Biomaibacter acetigenes]
MPERIASFSCNNFPVKMGKLWYDSSTDALASLTVVIGKNGAGKSTHFVDALNPEDVWILEKQGNGFSTVRRASEDPIVTALV